MPVIDIEGFRVVAKADPEFSRAMRYYDGAIKLSVGATEHHILGFSQGALLNTTDADGNCQIEVVGTVEHWEHLLEEFPLPFYQCLQSTAVKHGLQLSETNATFAYLPALNRMIQLMRVLRKGR